jgi:peptidyl-prolyl cis-trans isomerase SurA
VREKLINGSISFGEAVVKYSDDEYAKFTAGRLSSRTGSPFLTIDGLDKDMVLLLKNTNLKPGEFSKPALFTDDRGKKGVRIVALFSKTEPHRENLKDDYNRIAQRALLEKQGVALQKWFASKISNYYIMIDNEYRTCVNLDKWKSRTTAVSK